MSLIDDFSNYLKSILETSGNDTKSYIEKYKISAGNFNTLKNQLLSDTNFQRILKERSILEKEEWIELLILKDLIDLQNSFSHKKSKISQLFLLIQSKNSFNSKEIILNGLEERYAKFEAEVNSKIDFKFPEKYPLYKLLLTNNSPLIRELDQLYLSFINDILNLHFKGDVPIHEALGMNIQIPQSKDVNEVKDDLKSVLKELNALVGLSNIKKEIEELTNLLSIQKSRTKKGLKNVDITLHTVFLGAPGTGKTTVARLLSRLFFHLGYISKGHLIETDREGLVAGYVGQTASKTNELIEKSKGGVLFIDEAYSLSEAGGTQDYGAEAISTLLKRMEDYRDDLIVIVAGYKEPINLFIQSNPGLRSRFTRYFEFKDFTSEELLSIFKNFCKNSDFKLNKEAEEKLTDILELLIEKKDSHFGNARDIRTLFEKCIQIQANRLIKAQNKKQTSLVTLIEDDIPDIKEVVKLLNLEN